MNGKKEYPTSFPPQTQDHQPGIEMEMNPRPVSESPTYQAAGKLQGKVALITGGDSGIGRAVAYAYAKEGADVVVVYLNEHQDAEETKQRVEAIGRRCLNIAADVGDADACQKVVEQALAAFGRLDVLVNNAAEQHPQKSLLDISQEQLLRTFQTNIFAMFYLTQAALPHLQAGSSIINTASITAYHGHKELIDYSATKGAIVTFTRSLSLNLAQQGIRVNAVAPGPIWTPLIPSTFTADQVAKFGADTPMGRAGQPEELAGAYVYLASDDASYVSGQTLHVNGGEIVNG
ncbi:NAD(P)-dependent oxidoreductase [Tumebacillus avium]|uniref:NAD(P)-dependent oxidoreductase n=1 Tax=Tumebacillus avium TaxID=1903704 RepID=A0A1Y0IK19_9BACL|nr:SDR family oxidoreductase [Tumebacillus avium]ARU60186.1 NAD(P)-dependent oxidoreductase [Tumebacillus avium]